MSLCMRCAGVFARESLDVGVYKCLDHKRDYSNVGSNVELLIQSVTGEHDYRSEGLNNVNYTVLSEELKYITPPAADIDTDDTADSGSDSEENAKGKSKGKGGKKKDKAAGKRKGFPYTHIKLDF